VGHHSAIEEILRVNRGRKPKRVRLKFHRMRADVFAFFRGTDHLFARAWAGGLRPIDPGPTVLCCGDLHLENFGAYRADDGAFLFDINDFDEADFAPCGFDLVRCVTSILLASDVWRLPPVQAQRLAVGFLDRYREAVTGPAARGVGPGMQYDTQGGPVHRLLGRASTATQAQLLARQTEPGKRGDPRIRRDPDLRPAVGRRRKKEVREAVVDFLGRNGGADVFRVLDVTGRVAGIGSLGVRRYLVLVRRAGLPGAEQLFDLKEVGPSSVTPFLGTAGPSPWPDDARRVVEAQSRLQARSAAGLGALEVGDRRFRIREMVPAENRTSLDRFRKETARLAHAVLVVARVTGWSQLRGTQLPGGCVVEDLKRWAAGPGLEGVLTAAVRHATRARRDYRAFCTALDRHGLRLMP
jgi:uncharacterized protein (DUF2252 family)